MGAFQCLAKTHITVISLGILFHFYYNHKEPIKYFFVRGLRRLQIRRPQEACLPTLWFLYPAHELSCLLRIL